MGTSRRRNRDASRRYHDRVARQYDAIYDDPYWHFHDELTWRLIKPFLPRDATAHCADLGCGTGKWGLRLLKSGYSVLFLDSAAAMVEQARAKVESLGHSRARKATFLAADIVEMQEVTSASLDLLLAMGDPLSICSDAQRATWELHRILKPEGIAIVTADNKLGALDHFVQRGSLDALEEFVSTGKTQWLTSDEREQFQLTTFTPAGVRKLFERCGFEVVEVRGKPVIPVRDNKQLLAPDDAIDRLIRLEMELHKDPAAAGRSGHLQIVARKPGTPNDVK
jgi:ubiquinone/menaquinone biosynthesis C-methylase UbiE